jgi:hypothetical protein
LILSNKHFFNQHQYPKKTNNNVEKELGTPKSYIGCETIFVLVKLKWLQLQTQLFSSMN